MKWIGIEPTGVVRPTSAGEQPTRPFAPDGLSTMPLGKVTVVSFRCEVESPHSIGGPGSHSVFCGTCTSRLSPVGESATLVVGSAVTSGLNSTWSQPVCWEADVSSETQVSGLPQERMLTVVVSGPVSQFVGAEVNGRVATPLTEAPSGVPPWVPSVSKRWSS